MPLFDELKQSGLLSVTRVIGGYTLATDSASDHRLHIYYSDGDTVLLTELGEAELEALKTKLGLNNRLGVLNIIAAALRDLQPLAAAATQLSIPLAKGSQREAEIRLLQPANQADARRRLFALVSARASDLAVQLDLATRALEQARSSPSGAQMIAMKLGAASGAAGGGNKRAPPRTALPGMSLVNPMQRKRRAAKGVVFDDDEEEAEEDEKSGDIADFDGKKGGKKK